MHRRIRHLALVATVLPLAACSADAAQDPWQLDPVITVWADESRAAALETLGQQYTAATGIAVEVVGRDNETIRDDFARAAERSDGPDVLVGAHDWLGALVVAGSVLAIDLPDPAAFVPVAVEAMAYDNVTYGVPLSTENVALVRNDALASTTPAAFDELVAQGEALVREGAADYPVLVQQTEASSDPYHLYPLQTSFGAPVFATHEDGSYSDELALGGDAGHAWADYLASLGERGVLSPAITADVARAAFLAGRSPYIVTGPWSTGEFLDAGLRISVLPVPAAGPLPSQPFVGVQGAFVNSGSLRPTESVDFVTRFLTTPEAQVALYQDSGRAPALRAAVEQITDDAVVRGFSAAGADGAPMPSIPQMAAVWTYWGGAEHLVIARDGDPHLLWDDLVSSISGAIASGAVGE
ncbi:sugar ABC transporter substrate-binding protein [Cellulomonas xylanilytica]|uniref:Sugar ABC transporter substrate-binding protein n=1 Tax=Cellulomonas xylanilytica TaxID=233583 RepID=A0A510UZ81_9CELL|nr:maltose ABC transporter substrate-binding protein [Cellulomonas xylanilytica]GEK19982.1 sugar ABC transporter substrate-binding protein [Cellulomonas xylanilytica]